MKKVEDLEVGDIIYIYSILSFPDREVMNTIEAKVYRTTKDYNSCSVYENYESNTPIRHVVKSNEGVVFRNSFWLSKKDDDLAESIMISYLKRKINIFENDIKLYRKRIHMVYDYFNN